MNSGRDPIPNRGIPRRRRHVHPLTAPPGTITPEPDKSYLDKANAVLPPEKPGQAVATIEPMPPEGRPHLPALPDGRTLDLATLADALRAVASYHEAAALPAPKNLAREATALVRAQIREARGLPGKPGANKNKG